MALYKRGSSNIYYVKLVDPRDGRIIRRSTRTSDRRKAQKLHDQLKASLWTASTSEYPARLWEEAVVKWLSERGHKRSIDDDKGQLRWLDPFLRGKHLHEISRQLIEHIVGQKADVTPATRNRYRALIRAILRAAEKEWEWIPRAPHIRLEPEPDRRVRFLTREEFERLAACLPHHLAQMARFSVATGIRQSNVTGLTWDRVDLARQRAWIGSGDTKNAEPLGIYLNSEALGVLRGQEGNHPEYVFTYRGRPIRQATTKAWYRALNKAGIEDFRWHDLRHTWASWHVQAGTPIFAVQEAAGWKSPQMARRYAHLTADHFADFAERIVGTKMDTPPGDP